ncbi:C1q-related factor [Sarotherodon galilaeus]
MSSSVKPKPGRYGSDIHRLLLAAEAGQKADILAYSSGHLGPRSLNQSQPQEETKSFFWRMSQSQEESRNPLYLQQIQTKAKKNEMKEFPPEFTSGTALVEPRVLGSTQDHTSHPERREHISLPQIVYRPSRTLQKACSQKNPKSPSDLGVNHHFTLSRSDQDGLNDQDQQEKKKCFGWQVMAKPDLWAGKNVAEMHARKLQEGLIKLSAQSWPSRDRLAVFSDVFDDVCEDSPVFGRILREIKTEYDLYVNHLMSLQSSPRSMSPSTSLKVSETELDDAEKEVCRLEHEARRALEEKKRVQNELQNISAAMHPKDSDKKNTCQSGLQDTMSVSGYTDSIQVKRLQVMNVWKEIKWLEEELEEKLVSTVTTTATKGHIRDQQTEIMKLIASNERLRAISKDLENNISAVLNREKASKAIRRLSSTTLILIMHHAADIADS